jgi:son of sevenless-like protein
MFWFYLSVYNILCAQVLMDMFYQEEQPISAPPPAVVTTAEDEDLPVARASVTYEEVVKDLIHDEKQYLRDLNMITKVFREEIGKLVTPFTKVFTIKSKINKIINIFLMKLDCLCFFLSKMLKK